MNLVIDQPMIYTIPPASMRLDHYYKLNSYVPFSQLENLQSLPALDTATLAYLVDNFHNMDLWMEHLPPANFTFSGFSIHSFVDVTVEEATALIRYAMKSLKNELIKRWSVGRKSALPNLTTLLFTPWKRNGLSISAISNTYRPMAFLKMSRNTSN